MTTTPKYSKAVQRSSKPRAPRTKGHYINKAEMLEEVKKSKAQGYMTPRFATMLLLLCENFAKKSTHSRYGYIDDLKGHAMLGLVKTWKSFNPEKSSNPFAFYTECIKNSFKQNFNKERKQRDIRDAVMMEHGLNPSHTFTEAWNESQTRSSDGEMEEYTNDSQHLSIDAPFDHVDHQPEHHVVRDELGFEVEWQPSTDVGGAEAPTDEDVEGEVIA